jgi:hypothetical protein
MLSMVVVAIFSKTVQQLLYNHGAQNIEADSISVNYLPCGTHNVYILFLIE